MKTVPERKKLCAIDRQALERDPSSQKKVLLRPLFKCTSVDGKSTEDIRNFKMVQLESPELKKMSNLCPGRAPSIPPYIEQ